MWQIYHLDRASFLLLSREEMILLALLYGYVTLCASAISPREIFAARRFSALTSTTCTVDNVSNMVTDYNTFRNGLL